jgi:hypothetical protein
MAFGEPDVYYQPHLFGLTQIAELDLYEPNYSFDLAVAWEHEDGTVYFATDAGCSCPSPFEWATSLEKLETVTRENFTEVVGEATDYSSRYGPPYPTFDARRAEFLATVARSLV